MNESLKVKVRLGIGLVFIFGAIGTFIFGWMERSDGKFFQSYLDVGYHNAFRCNGSAAENWRWRE